MKKVTEKQLKENLDELADEIRNKNTPIIIELDGDEDCVMLSLEQYKELIENSREPYAPNG